MSNSNNNNNELFRYYSVRSASVQTMLFSFNLHFMCWNCVTFISCSSSETFHFYYHYYWIFFNVCRLIFNNFSFLFNGYIYGVNRMFLFLYISTLHIHSNSFSILTECDRMPKNIRSFGSMWWCLVISICFVFN